MKWIVLALVLGVATVGRACPTCTCGNPALLSIGADQPFDGRIRVGSSVRAWGQRDPSGIELREVRVDLLASWSPVRRWTFTVNLPVQLRERTEVSLARERGLGPGELDLSGRFLIVGAAFRPKHLLAAVASVRLPTAPTLADAEGRVFDLDAQLGPGSFVPGAGLTWSWFLNDQFSTFASLMAEVPIEGRFGLRMGPQVQLIASGQYQPWSRLGLRLGIDGRVEAPATLRGVTSTAASGVLLQALADVVVSATSTVLVSAGARVPLADLRIEAPKQTPILLVALVVDL